MEKPSAQSQAEDRASLQQHRDRHKFLRNPRFLLPNAQRGGKSLIMPGKRPEYVGKGRKKTGKKRCVAAFDFNVFNTIFEGPPHSQFLLEKIYFRAWH